MNSTDNKISKDTCTKEGCSENSEFQFFILATTWQPELCNGNYDVFMGCNDPHPFWSSELTLRGLWPENFDGSFPCCCEAEEFSVDELAPVGIQLLYQKWPNVQFDVFPSEGYPNLWEHEWYTHGSCSNFSQTVFFQTALSLLSTYGTPHVIEQNVGDSVELTDLITAYGGNGMSVFKCKEEKYIFEVYQCFSIQLTRIPCPDSILARGNCRTPIFVRDFVPDFTPIFWDLTITMLAMLSLSVICVFLSQRTMHPMQQSSLELSPQEQELVQQSDPLLYEIPEKKE